MDTFRLPFWLLPIAVLCGQWVPSPRGQRLIAAMQAALSRSRIAGKEAAAIQGLTHTQWSRQLTLRDGAHPSLARAGDLPDDVLGHFVEELGSQLGLRVVRDEKIAELIAKLDGLQVELLRMQLAEREKKSA